MTMIRKFNKLFNRISCELFPRPDKKQGGFNVSKADGEFFPIVQTGFATVEEARDWIEEWAWLTLQRRLASGKTIDQWLEDKP